MVELLDCPHEIIRDVLGNLELADLKNARLACKTLGVIGAETLLPAIHVVFTKQSIERLRDVSLHPVISLHVNEIVYEADRVDHYDQQEDWERDVVDSEYLANLSPESVAGLQLMLPDNPKKVYHEYSRKKLDSGWKRYQALHKEQLDICRRESDKRELGRAVMRMPHLERITISVGQGLTPGLVSPYFVRSFTAMLVPVGGENALKDNEPPGFRHFLPLLMPFTSPEKYDIKALHKKQIPIAQTLDEGFKVSALTRLCIRGISWLALQQLRPVMSALPVALAKIKTLILAFNTGEVDSEQVGIELEDCADYLRESDDLKQFLSACPSLTKLDLSFGSISPEAQAASLEHIVGNTRWKNLHQINFCRFKIPAKQFCLFLKRHRDSLRDVVLKDMCAGKVPETWSTFLSDVRALNIPWKRFQAVGNLHQDGVTNVTLSVNSSLEDGRDPAQMIEDYVMKKTDFNVLDAAIFNEETGETIWHDEWEDVSDDDEMEVAEA